MYERIFFIKAVRSFLRKLSVDSFCLRFVFKNLIFLKTRIVSRCLRVQYCRIPYKLWNSKVQCLRLSWLVCCSSLIHNPLCLRTLKRKFSGAETERESAGEEREKQKWSDFAIRQVNPADFVSVFDLVSKGVKEFFASNVSKNVCCGILRKHFCLNFAQFFVKILTLLWWRDEANNGKRYCSFQAGGKSGLKKFISKLPSFGNLID